MEKREGTLGNPAFKMADKLMRPSWRVMYAVLDPDPDIRVGGGAGEAQYPKKFFWFGLKIGMGGGRSHPGPSTTGMYVPNLNYKYGHFTF